MKKIWILPVLVLFLLVGQVAEGGVLSAVVGFLTSSVGQVDALVKQEEEIKTETNSQNLDLPRPDINWATSSPKAELDQTIVGGSAILPESGPLGTAADLKDNQAPSDLISVYVVHKGDNIEMIAQMFNVSPNTIRWANDIKKGEVIKAGDRLVILPITGIKHTIAKGETLAGLAKKYKSDTEEIANYNNIDVSKDLIVGNIIIIPDGEDGTVVSSAKKAPAKYSGPSSAGYFLRPISGGKRSQGLHGHNAVDLAAPVGTSLYAAASGKVLIAKSSGWNGGYGNYVVIAHPNGTQTLYAHMNKVNTWVGAYVEKGEVIGQVGSTGRSTGAHVHFEIRGASNPF
ncbi:MAG TPA: peptidoglycan DD-metalloendopeptidase family protein [Candidatus Paceibacterota bacterium]|nr:peptidoglycan DD-metalloendopeptidase family protein [Candidatus Paceibacterota bacterium]